MKKFGSFLSDIKYPLLFAVVVVGFLTLRAAKIAVFVGEQPFAVKIMPAMTNEDLAAVSNQLEANGVVMHIDSLSRNDRGNIQSIALHVKGRMPGPACSISCTSLKHWISIESKELLSLTVSGS